MKQTVAGRLRTHAAWRAQALFLRLFWLVVGAMPPERASAAGSSLARSIGPYLRRHRKIRRNLATALPERRPGEIDALARAVWGNFGAVLAEFPHLAALCDGTGADARIEVIDWIPPEDKRTRIFVLAHLANWEVVPRLILQRNASLLAIYSPQDNPLVERLVQQRRSLADCEFGPSTGSSQKVVAALREGSCVGMLTDQRIDGGLPIEFFGREAETTDMPARLAVKFGCALVPVRVERLGHARFRVTFHEPLEPAPSEVGQKAKALDMTRRVQTLFEAWIRERPDQWLCTKRRWNARRDRPLPATHEERPPVRAAGA